MNSKEETSDYKFLSLKDSLTKVHRDRFCDEYFEVFNKKEITRHLEALSLLSPDTPVQVLIDQHGDRIQCTVIGFDYSSEFSLITGILAGMGLNILIGNVFTCEAVLFKNNKRALKRGGKRKKIEVNSMHRRCIIDSFSGKLKSDYSLYNWMRKLKGIINDVILLLEKGGFENQFKAKHIVNELVANQLREKGGESLRVLFPVEIKVENGRGSYTTLRVISQDTPVFLYSLTNALSSCGVSIERVRIKTVRGMVEDEIDILDLRGNEIVDKKIIDKIKLFVLLTKQFTSFLGKAPDPYVALLRFEQLAENIAGFSDNSYWLELFSKPDALADLAKILGASDFIWEDFVRVQYEELLPVLNSDIEDNRVDLSFAGIEKRLKDSLEGIKDYDKKRECLNSWKDHEIFRADMDHILHGGANVRLLAGPLTSLAEVVVKESVNIVYEDLVRKFGVPRTVGGIETKFAVFGLGKFGGEALGYASDIELLFLYSDNGKTDGPRSIKNSEFFNYMAEDVSKFITARREGIFHIDLRLRPYGNSGPKACSLENFCRYYGVSGEAHSYECLALIRLRKVGGDRELGLRVERLRDEFIYTGRSIDMEELKRLRDRQFEEKAKGFRYNAKFSPGALVDIEYYVQILQVTHGKYDQNLRTPRIHEALTVLSNVGVLSSDESVQLTEAYYFLRHLINGLRMLRGNALDLFLPAFDSYEYTHLARRLGYESGKGGTPEQKLHLEFQTHTAVVRAFIEKHFGRESLIDPEHGNVVDLILSRNPESGLRNKVLSKVGFSNINRAYLNLTKLAGDGKRRDSFIRLAVLACDIMNKAPDSDMALNNWERFVKELHDPKEHYDILLSQPGRLEILMGVFAGSQFLSDTLVKNPEFFDWVTDPVNLKDCRDSVKIREDFDEFNSNVLDSKSLRNKIRIFRRREILRIGIRDICLNASIREVTLDLSLLADFITDVSLSHECMNISNFSEGNIKDYFCVIALGKLGGSELNYSSDIDLLGIYDKPAGMTFSDAQILFGKLMEHLSRSLSGHTEEGYSYRVDLRLRPHGRAGQLVWSVPALIEYYKKDAQFWEIQALLKVRPIAGNIDIGQIFIDKLKPVIVEKSERENVILSIKKMRSKVVDMMGTFKKDDLKTGIGGIRDVEFLVQGLQLINLTNYPDLFTGNTLCALELLKEKDLLPSETIFVLKEDYMFLRKVEHYIQIMEYRQTHSLPKDKNELTALAKRLLCPSADIDLFLDILNKTRKRIRDIFNLYMNPDCAFEKM